MILALSPTGSACSQIWQYPRFTAKKRGSKVEIYCQMEVTGSVTWFWQQDMDSEPQELAMKPGRIQQTQGAWNATLTIADIQFQDNGIYFCQHRRSDGSPETGCGSELRVMGGCGARPPAGRGVGVDGAPGLRGAIHSLPPGRGPMVEEAVVWSTQVSC